MGVPALEPVHVPPRLRRHLRRGDRTDTYAWQLSNGQFVDGSWTFAALTGHYYKVRQRLYWYATPESNAISITTWSTIDGFNNIPQCQVNP